MHQYILLFKSKHALQDSTDLTEMIDSSFLPIAKSQESPTWAELAVGNQMTGVKTVQY
ncbi:hypothetical protein [Echinicola salinicaeni]|uniref:hypothetical protein n=1 Tax=Echinicola salinicaeni TaxID=2762757 RepID=UPI001644DC5F|nr:hypothetical protein [Echinicola salinicaeni]